MRRTRLVILPGARCLTQMCALLLYLSCPNIGALCREHLDISRDDLYSEAFLRLKGNNDILSDGEECYLVESRINCGNKYTGNHNGSENTCSDRFFPRKTHIKSEGFDANQFSSDRDEVPDLRKSHLKVLCREERLKFKFDSQINRKPQTNLNKQTIIHDFTQLDDRHANLENRRFRRYTPEILLNQESSRHDNHKIFKKYDNNRRTIQSQQEFLIQRSKKNNPVLGQEKRDNRDASMKLSIDVRGNNKVNNPRLNSFIDNSRKLVERETQRVITKSKGRRMTRENNENGRRISVERSLDRVNAETESHRSFIQKLYNSDTQSERGIIYKKYIPENEMTNRYRRDVKVIDTEKAREYRINYPAYLERLNQLNNLRRNPTERDARRNLNRLERRQVIPKTIQSNEDNDRSLNQEERNIRRSSLTELRNKERLTSERVIRESDNRLISDERDERRLNNDIRRDSAERNARRSLNRLESQQLFRETHQSNDNNDRALNRERRNIRRSSSTERRNKEMVASERIIRKTDNRVISDERDIRRFNISFNIRQDSAERDARRLENQQLFRETLQSNNNNDRTINRERRNIRRSSSTERRDMERLERERVIRKTDSRLLSDERDERRLNNYIRRDSPERDARRSLNRLESQQLFRETLQSNNNNDRTLNRERRNIRQSSLTERRDMERLARERVIGKTDNRLLSDERDIRRLNNDIRRDSTERDARRSLNRLESRRLFGETIQSYDNNDRALNREGRNIRRSSSTESRNKERLTSERWIHETDNRLLSDERDIRRLNNDIRRDSAERDARRSLNRLESQQLFRKTLQSNNNNDRTLNRERHNIKRSSSTERRDMERLERERVIRKTDNKLLSDERDERRLNNYIRRDSPERDARRSLNRLESQQLFRETLQSNNNNDRTLNWERRNIRQSSLTERRDMERLARERVIGKTDNRLLSDERDIRRLNNDIRRDSVERDARRSLNRLESRRLFRETIQSYDNNDRALNREGRNIRRSSSTESRNKERLTSERWIHETDNRLLSDERDIRRLNNDIRRDSAERDARRSLNRRESLQLFRQILQSNGINDRRLNREVSNTRRTSSPERRDEERFGSERKMRNSNNRLFSVERDTRHTMSRYDNTRTNQGNDYIRQIETDVLFDHHDFLRDNTRFDRKFNNWRISSERDIPAEILDKDKQVRNSDVRRIYFKPNELRIAANLNDAPIFVRDIRNNKRNTLDNVSRENKDRMPANQNQIQLLASKKKAHRMIQKGDEKFEDNDANLRQNSRLHEFFRSEMSVQDKIRRSSVERIIDRSFDSLDFRFIRNKKNSRSLNSERNLDHQNTERDNRRFSQAKIRQVSSESDLSQSMRRSEERKLSREQRDRRVYDSGWIRINENTERVPSNRLISDKRIAYTQNGNENRQDENRDQSVKPNNVISRRFNGRKVTRQNSENQNRRFLEKNNKNWRFGTEEQARDHRRNEDRKLSRKSSLSKLSFVRDDSQRSSKGDESLLSLYKQTENRESGEESFKHRSITLDDKKRLAHGINLQRALHHGRNEIVRKQRMNKPSGTKQTSTEITTRRSKERLLISQHNAAIAGRIVEHDFLDKEASEVNNELIRRRFSAVTKTQNYPDHLNDKGYFNREEKNYRKIGVNTMPYRRVIEINSYRRMRMMEGSRVSRENESEERNSGKIHRRFIQETDVRRASTERFTNHLEERKLPNGMAHTTGERHILLERVVRHSFSRINSNNYRKDGEVSGGIAKKGSLQHPITELQHNKRNSGEQNVRRNSSRRRTDFQNDNRLIYEQHKDNVIRRWSFEKNTRYEDKQLEKRNQQTRQKIRENDKENAYFFTTQRSIDRRNSGQRKEQSRASRRILSLRDIHHYFKDQNYQRENNLKYYTKTGERQLSVGSGIRKNSNVLKRWDDQRNTGMYLNSSQPESMKLNINENFRDYKIYLSSVEGSNSQNKQLIKNAKLVKSSYKNAVKHSYLGSLNSVPSQNDVRFFKLNILSEAYLADETINLDYERKKSIVGTIQSAVYELWEMKEETKAALVGSVACLLLTTNVK